MGFPEDQQRFFKNVDFIMTQIVTVLAIEEFRQKNAR